MGTPTRCALVAGFLAACGGTEMGAPDGAMSDAGSGSPGLFVSWSTQPTIPGNATNVLTLEAVTLRFDHLRVIGDAGPGDPRTTDPAFTLDWGPGTTPAPIAFPDAPAGLYSKVSIQLDGNVVNASYHFAGHVVVNGVRLPYSIDDRDPLAVSLTINEPLAPGGSATVALSAKIDHALDAIDFSLLPFDDGRLRLVTGNAQMSNFRAKLIESFVVDATAPN